MLRTLVRGAPLLIGSALLLLTSCAGDDCDADIQTLPTCGGDMLDDSTWESGPLDGTYLNFHGERTWIFNPSGWVGDRVPTLITPYLSLIAQPNAEGGAPGYAGFTLGPGNMAEITAFPSGGGYQIQVLNNTCAQYYLRVVIQYADAGSPTTSGTCSAQGSGG
jgi:hypothetical protein